MDEELTETEANIHEESMITHAGTPKRVSSGQHSLLGGKQRRPRFAAKPSDRWLAAATPGINGNIFIERNISKTEKETSHC